MKISLLLSVLVVGAALAGCTGTPPADDPLDTNMTTSTPPTPTTTTPATNGTDETEAPDAPLDCPTPPATNATPGEVMGYPELVFTVKEPNETTSDPCFGFVGPATATAGWTAVTLRNDGMQPHIMPMYAIGNHTLEEAQAALGSNETPPEWLVPVGGVGVATPFSSGTSILNLTEGNYLVICFFGGHHMQGMYRLLEVEAAPANATPAEEPVSNLTIELRDFAFGIPENISAGKVVVKFHNAGTQPHEAPLIQLQGNATIQEFIAAVESETPQGPPPGMGVGGVNIIAPGDYAYAVVDLVAGANYGLLCFVEDPASHSPHVALGMTAQFTVDA